MPYALHMRYDNEFEDDYEEDDPNNPEHPDHDLSESAPYSSLPRPDPWYMRRWVMLIVAIMVIFALVVMPIRNII